MIKLQNISKVYGKKASETRALKDVSLEVKKQEFIAIMGASGCGKSTLLNILGVIDKPTSGKYILNGEEIKFNNINKLSEVRNSKIAFIFQNFALINDMTIKENCLLPLRFRKEKKEEKLKKVDKYLKELGLSEMENKPVKDLSGGQQQRVAIARALVQDTDIILADEPTGALDEENTINILNLFCELNKKYGKTIIMVTHDKMVAEYAESIYIMKDGIFIDKINKVKI